ncbi:MAG: hypothetical protein HONBIEJF_00839 [Fimbriimonadaceae bacterium]|nr:hypothetical protein [Fimbriimonadaceae bacterium]
MRRLMLLLLVAGSTVSGAATLFTYPHNGTGSLIASSHVWEDGSDSDMYAYESFILPINAEIQEIRWRGGYIHDALYGRLTGFDITIYASIQGDWQPYCGNPDMDETIYLACYEFMTNAGETSAGTFGGKQLYDYHYTLPQPFVATAGVKYWLKIEGRQAVYPDWGIAVGTGGDGQHFHFSTGMARFYWLTGDTTFALLGSSFGEVLVPVAYSVGPQGQEIGANDVTKIQAMDTARAIGENTQVASNQIPPLRYNLEFKTTNLNPSQIAIKVVAQTQWANIEQRLSMLKNDGATLTRFDTFNYYSPNVDIQRNADTTNLGLPPGDYVRPDGGMTMVVQYRKVGVLPSVKFQGRINYAEIGIS